VGREDARKIFPWKIFKTGAQLTNRQKLHVKREKCAARILVQIPFAQTSGKHFYEALIKKFPLAPLLRCSLS